VVLYFNKRDNQIEDNKEVVKKEIKVRQNVEKLTKEKTENKILILERRVKDLKKKKISASKFEEMILLGSGDKEIVNFYNYLQESLKKNIVANTNISQLPGI
jgi:hypothetical protein